MNDEALLRAVSGVGDDLLLEATPVSVRRSVTALRRRRVSVCAAAACLCLVLLTGFRGGSSGETTASPEIVPENSAIHATVQTTQITTNENDVAVIDESTQGTDPTE